MNMPTGSAETAASSGGTDCTCAGMLGTDAYSTGCIEILPSSRNRR
jgi:hypothetical protein